MPASDQRVEMTDLPKASPLSGLPDSESDPDMIVRDILWLGCMAGDHVWLFVGGRNAGCERGEDCGCSVPVHECAKCHDCDYGANAEADAVRQDCLAGFG